MLGPLNKSAPIIPQMGEIAADLRRAHIAGMAFIMEQDKTFDPLDVAMLGSDTIVSYANRLTFTLQQR